MCQQKSRCRRPCNQPTRTVCKKISRDKDLYTQAAKEAGIQVQGKFSRETVLALKSIMPMTTWRLLKRTFKIEFGVDVLGSEKKLREELEEMQFTYEYGSFESEERGEAITVNYIRVTDVREVVTKTVEELKANNKLTKLDNISPDTLWLCVSGDKGGNSTKLMLQVMNSKTQHSIKQAKLLGLFEGGRDTRKHIEVVFKDIIADVCKLQREIADMKLEMPDRFQCDNPECMEKKRSEVPSSADEQVHKKTSFKPLQPFNEDNQTLSADCAYCKHERGNIERCSPRCTQTAAESEELLASSPQCAGSATMDVDDGQQESSSTYTHCKLSWGGDWEWLARLLGVTGPNGRYFCLHCYCTLSDLCKGKPHAYHVLDKYKDLFPDTVPARFAMRTFEDCERHSMNFASAVKAKAFDHFNCEALPLIKAPGFVIDSLTVTPLHLCLGVGLLILNLIESMALDLDKTFFSENGVHTDDMESLVESRRKLSEELLSSEKETCMLEEQSRELEKSINCVKEKYAKYYQKSGGKLIDKSTEGKEARKEQALKENALLEQLKKIHVQQ
ncbi:uncharacterized protein [Ptychodera flava]|uniref:uncharacterized protein n=1 Tax=Ptychodera flava TaxID=63121 RepID=UPI003969E39B